MSADQIGLWAGFILTLMVFSYLLGDNFLYRLAVYIFVGLAAGYITMVTVESVLVPWVRGTILAPAPEGRIVGVIPLILGGLLFLKGTKRFQALGKLGLAFLIGVGAAVAVVGAISGTLLPLTAGTVESVRTDALNGFIILLGVVCTLIYFQFLARRRPGGEIRRGAFGRAFGAVGQGFVVVALGALYGGAILTALVIFTERVAFLLARINGG